MKSPRILMIVSNPAISTTLNVPVGFWISELTHPYHAFLEAGYDVTFASPKGGKVEVDGWSDPRDDSRYSASDVLSLGYLTMPEFTKLLENTPSIEGLSESNFDAIVVCGGQGPMFTFRDIPRLPELFMDFYNAGKISAALCHGTCVLIDTKLPNGDPLVKGKTVTGFANVEEDFADNFVGTKVMPFRIEDELRALGANFIRHEAFAPFAVRVGNLITGQQQNSGAKTAELVIEALGKGAVGGHE